MPHLTIHTTADIEIRIARKVLRTVWDKMTPAQQREMEKQLQDVAHQLDASVAHLTQGSGLVALLLAGKLSGFGVYLLASTSLGTVTGVLGFTLPFAVYTTMSSTITVLLGAKIGAHIGIATGGVGKAVTVPLGLIVGVVGG